MRCDSLLQLPVKLAKDPILAYKENWAPHFLAEKGKHHPHPDLTASRWSNLSLWEICRGLGYIGGTTEGQP